MTKESKPELPPKGSTPVEQFLVDEMVYLRGKIDDVQKEMSTLKVKVAGFAALIGAFMHKLLQ